ncbi:hypothetical protein [Corallococcus exercitus]|uniref:Uncharacterized protein n=1 Tax=Corallococcus exercitus TaxID=2316736 RepID=A0A7Y4JPJ9_9BACT|nr:hypothetical protein [Corallococcus exercitus]NOK08624.1 hypothetical protein [Corallococcus exercitus]
MSWSIQIPAVNTLKLALGNAAHEQALGHAELNGHPAIPIQGGKVSLMGALKVPVELFNDRDDQDAYGIIGVPPKELDGSTAEPLFSPDGAACWLKYAAELSAEANGQGNFPFVELSGGGSLQVKVADYRHHAATKTLEDALGSDAKSLRLPFVLGDVQALQPGDALSFQTRVELKAGVKVSWSAISTSLVAALARRLAGQLVFELKAEAGASIGGTVSLQDEFRIVFSRPKDGGPFRVSVRKATSDAAAVHVSAGVSLNYASPLLASILAAADSKVQDAMKLVEGLEQGALTPALLQVAAALLKQLGFLKAAEPTLASVKAAYEELKDLVESVVSGALKAGFEYEYARSTEDATLLELEVPVQELAGAHGAFISGDLASIQHRVNDAWLRRYFHMKSVESQRVWGLGLGWRDVNFASQEDRRKLRSVVQHASRDHRQGPRRYAFLGARSYTSSGLLYGKTSRWGLDFNAQMPRFSLTPSADEFDYSLFAQSEVEDGLSKDLIQRAVDAATVWGAVLPQDAPALVERLFRAAPAGTKTTTRLELRVDCPSFRRLLAKLGSEPVFERNAFARGLARALPRASQPVRASLQRREELYAPLWDAYLKDGAKDWTLDKARATVAYHLKTQAGADGFVASHWEQGGATGTFSDVLVQASRYGGDIGSRPYGKVYAFWKDLLDKLSALNKAIQLETVIAENDATSAVQQVFTALDDLVCDDFRVAAFVAWLDQLSVRWKLGSGVQRTLQVRVGDQEFVVSHG